jgi:outer membrane lipoprotein-sorting protein
VSPPVPRLIIVSLLAMALGAGLAAGPAEDTATQFLDAWVFHDAAQVWTLLDDASRQGLTQESLAAVMEAQPLVAESAEVVSAQADGGALRVRFRLQGHHRTSGEEMSQPGTLVVVPGGDGQTMRVSFRLPSAPAAPPQAASVAAAAQQALPALPPSQVIDGHTAQEILNAAAERAGQVQTLRMNLTMRGSMMGQPVDMAGQFLFQAPNQLRLDVGQALFVFDGAGGICHLPEAHAFFRLPASMSQELIGFAPGLGGSTADAQASLIGREDVSGQLAWHLAVASAPGSASGSLGPMDIWLDTQSLLPVRAQTASMGMVADLHFSDVLVNGGPLPPEAFEFEPPPDAVEVPMMLPGLPGLGTGG